MCRAKHPATWGCWGDLWPKGSGAPATGASSGSQLSPSGSGQALYEGRTDCWVWLLDAGCAWAVVPLPVRAVTRQCVFFEKRHAAVVKDQTLKHFSQSLCGFIARTRTFLPSLLPQQANPSVVPAHCAQEKTSRSSLRLALRRTPRFDILLKA